MTAVVLLALLAALPWWLGEAHREHGQRAGSRRQHARRRRHRPERRAAPPDPAVLLDLADVALAAGASVPDALHGLGVALGPGRYGSDLAAAGTALRLGASWPQAWSGTVGLLGPLAAALEPAWLDGADPGPLVRRAADGVRARRQRAAREAAERLGARLVLPLGLCFLPAFVLLSLVPVLLSGGRSVLGG